MSINDHIRNIYSIQKQLKRDEIVELTSRMIKGSSHQHINGMCEIGHYYISDLDTLLQQLDDLEKKLNTP